LLPNITFFPVTSQIFDIVWAFYLILECANVVVFLILTKLS
jgi:hypothetical protein